MINSYVNTYIKMDSIYVFLIQRMFIRENLYTRILL